MSIYNHAVGATSTYDLPQPLLDKIAASNSIKSAITSGTSNLVTSKKLDEELGGVKAALSSGAIVDVEDEDNDFILIGSNFKAESSQTSTESQKDLDYHRSDILISKFRRKTSAPVKRNSKAAVAIVADDYVKDTIEIFAPLMKSRGLPWSWALNGGVFEPGYMYSTFNGSYNWDGIRTFLSNNDVEIVNHGWSHTDVRDIALMNKEIIQSRSKLMSETGQDVLGFIPPGVDYPEGVNFKSSPLINTLDEEFLVGKSYDLVTRYNHAWVTGTNKDFKENEFVHPLDGNPRSHVGRQWLEYGSNAGLTVGGIGDKLIQKAISSRKGCILSLHAAKIEGGGLTKTMDLSMLTAFLDRLVALQNSGDIVVVKMSDWHATELI